jgi:hypothetical protein
MRNKRKACKLNPNGLTTGDIIKPNGTAKTFGNIKMENIPKAKILSEYHGYDIKIQILEGNLKNQEAWGYVKGFELYENNSNNYEIY